MTINSEIPDKQRVLILQGGGALGAYQVGALKALAKRLPEIDAKKGETNRPLFDIIAGTSIGAINATILVSYLKDHKGRWYEACERLKEFWNYISEDTNRFIDTEIHWWESDHKNDRNAASAEAARRYYSAKHFLKNGSRGIFCKPIFVEDDKFFDYSISLPNNQSFLYSNEELKKTISDPRFAKFPIDTSMEEPRLLIVSTDVGDGATVTFDSYSEESEYGRIDERSGKYLKRTITYPKGIEISHVMASSCIPLFYEHEEIQGRKFWDGGVLSNTPLREVIHMHRDYWFKKIGKGEPGSKVPNLEIYIIGVWPSSEDGDSVNNDNEIPSDYDGLKAKFYDINLSDKTEYDEKSATMVSDLIEIIGNIRSLAPKYMNLEQQKEFDIGLQNFLNRDAQSKGRDGEKRSYGSLLNGRVKLDKVVRIELRESKNDISNKAFDLSTITTMKLIKQGEEDTKDMLKD